LPTVTSNMALVNWQIAIPLLIQVVEN
jgi:hypothetical protein